MIRRLAPPGVELTEQECNHLQYRFLRYARMTRREIMWTTIAAACTVAVTLAVIFIGKAVLEPYVPEPADVLLATVVAAPIAAWLGYRTTAWIYRRHIAEQLRHMGYDVCGRCFYNLTGLDAGAVRCPECGEPRVPAQQ